MKSGPAGPKVKSGFKKIVFSRAFATLVLAIAQMVFLVVVIYNLAYYGSWIYNILTIVSVIVFAVVFEQDELNPAYKLMWLLIIVLLPLSGAVLYLLWGHRNVPRRQRRQLYRIERGANAAMAQDEAYLDALAARDRRLHQSALYLANFGRSPVWPASGLEEYYPLGEDFFPRFLDTIRAAKRYIFMEYYILEPGVMLDATLEILRQKAAEGVDVRFIWDGFGSMFNLPHDFADTLRGWGIKCYAFSPIRLRLIVSSYAMLNHRDHRKITVVDGKVGFSGGLNFADEYINVKERFGEWKDTAFLIRGEAVYNLTNTFLRAWDFVSGENSDYAAYHADSHWSTEWGRPSFEKGYIQPYWDSPLDGENVSENAYLNVIRHAQDYVYICTPYLILDHEMITNLTLAAKSGVDVRILTPGIPDKPTVYLVTQSYYRILLKEGVRIFQYTPGFNHAKMYVSDDTTAIVGSANMDYRSLYLHFENCVAFYGGPVVPATKKDMLESFAKSHEVTLAEVEQMPFWRRFIQIIAKFFAPMM